jgi:hypothetical protein
LPEFPQNKYGNVQQIPAQQIRKEKPPIGSMRKKQEPDEH